MQTNAAAAAVLTSLFLTAGCLSPATTRLPTLGFGPPEAELRTFRVHDPLPETDIAPDTQSRPRGFEEQRSEPRRTLEGQIELGPQMPPRPAAPPLSTGQYYPSSVPQ